MSTCEGSANKTGGAVPQINLAQYVACGLEAPAGLWHQAVLNCRKCGFSYRKSPNLILTNQAVQIEL